MDAWTQTLPELTQRERDCALAVITHKHRYPFAARTPGVVAPTPQIAEKTLGGHEFYRQPFKRTKFTIWLFDTPEARERFLEVFPGEPL